MTAKARVTPNMLNAQLRSLDPNKIARNRGSHRLVIHLNDFDSDRSLLYEKAIHKMSSAFPHS